MATDRRKFLQILSASAAAAVFPPSIKRALAIPGNHRTGSIADVEHIVVLMQENRSFDHYFGTLRGVRGFGDPRAVSLPSGDPVWYQPNGQGTLLPYRPDVDLGAAFMKGTPHGWPDTHQAWNRGKYDQWVAAKGTNTMTYLTRRDIPYHFALADAFTVCDAYHCSFLGATDPNRYHMWTGWVGNDGKNGGPVLDNSEAGYDWSTYPERLQKAGISWKIYQDVGAGLDADHYWGWGENPYIGNYGDNSLLYFHQYQSALSSDALHQRAVTGTNVSAGGTLFDAFRRDVAIGQLPQVSWIVPPEAYTEHPNWPPNYGAWYVSEILDALTAHPEVWSKTAFFLMYDENDGFFDHMIPPTPPQSRAEGLSTIETTNEIFAGNAEYAPGPYGLGVRVPMIVISPWSKGGWVNSEVFDHTSLIRFIEARFADRHPELIETNITPWRRAVVGDLTSAFDFKTPNARVVSLPSTVDFAPTDQEKHADFVPVPPVEQTLPAQEAGVRPARAVPYELHATADVDVTNATLAIHFANSGKSAAVFHVRSGEGDLGPWTYTVGPKDQITESWDLAALGRRAYDFSVYGPNGFLRAFKGFLGSPAEASLRVECMYHGAHGLSLEIENRSQSAREVGVWEAYSKRRVTRKIRPHGRASFDWTLDGSFGWYDFTIDVADDSNLQVRVAGHVESGQDSMSDPMLGLGASS